MKQKYSINITLTVEGGSERHCDEIAFSYRDVICRELRHALARNNVKNITDFEVDLPNQIEPTP